MLNLFKQLPRDNYFMLVAVFFMKGGQFMVMPFLAIYLQHFTHATPTKIGIAIGLGPLVYGCFSPLGGWLVDRFGARSMTALSLFLGALNIFFFFSVETWPYCFFMSAMLGVTRSVFDISSRTYRMHEQTLHVRRFAFGLRFTVINSAAGLGPIIGAIFASHHSLVIFHFIGVWYIALSFLSWLVLKAQETRSLTDGARVSLQAMWAILSRDRTMGTLILAAIVFWMAFSQIDSTLPQYLQTRLPHSLKLYAILLMINAIMCASLQMLMSHALRNFKTQWVNRVAVALFCLSFLILSIAASSYFFISAIVLMTLAELLLAPIQDYLVSLIATPTYLGSYYGAMGISILGIGIGPIFGGIIYQHSSGWVLFLCCAALSLIMGYAYHRVFQRITQLNLETPAGDLH